MTKTLIDHFTSEPVGYYPYKKGSTHNLIPDPPYNKKHLDFKKMKPHLFKGIFCKAVTISD